MKSIGALVLLAALAACADKATDDRARSEPTVTSSETPDPTPTASRSSYDASVVRSAIADLAQQEGVEPDEVTVVSREEVTWRDGSLGCAEPGMSYTQALVEGTRIVLSLAGKDYEYHAGGGRPPFLCERPTQ